MTRLSERGRLLSLLVIVLVPFAIVALVVGAGLDHRTSRPLALPSPSASVSASPCVLELCLPSISPIPSIPVQVLVSPPPAVQLSPRPRPVPVPVIAPPPRAPGDWPMFGYDNGHTGVNPQDAQVTAANFAELRPSWADSGAAGLPAIGAGHVFLPDLGFVGVHADSATCSQPFLSCPEQWRLSRTGSDGLDGMFSAALVRGQVVIPDQYGNVYAFSETPCGRPNCTPAWTGQTVGRVSGELAVDGPDFFVGTSNVGNTTQIDGRLYAFPLVGCGGASCPPAWVGRIPGGGALTGVATGGGRAFVADGLLRAFPSGGCGAAECPPAWTAHVSAEDVPTYAGGTVFGSGYDGSSGATNLYAVDAGSGVVRWNVTAYQGQRGGTYWTPHPSVNGGSVYIFDPAGRVRVFDANTGTARWTAPGTTRFGAGPVIADGLVFVALPADANGNGGGIAIYGAGGCGAPSCVPLATLPSGGNPAPGAVAAVSAGRVYTDTVEVYALPGH